MSKHEIINDHKGQPAFVKVPIEEWQDMRDVIQARETLARIDSGEEETFPGEVVFAIVNGANAIKTYRTYRGLTQTELAEKAGLKQPAIARAEKGGQPSVAVIKAISEALNVDMDMLV